MSFGGQKNLLQVSKYPSVPREEIILWRASGGGLILRAEMMGS